jgi:predicted ATP-dependent endonuclease of OLD family
LASGAGRDETTGRTNGRRSNRSGQERTLIAYDEPDLHLHPALLVRVLGLFETLSRREPVVLATQSDRLLDALDDPLQSVVLSRLVQEDPTSVPETKLIRPNRDALERWTRRYRGLGSLRSEGFEDLVMTEAER